MYSIVFHKTCRHKGGKAMSNNNYYSELSKLDTELGTGIYSSLNNSTIHKEITGNILDKLSGRDIAQIAIAIIGGVTIGYICNKGGSLDINYGELGVSLSSPDRAA